MHPACIIEKGIRAENLGRGMVDDLHGRQFKEKNKMERKVKKNKGRKKKKKPNEELKGKHYIKGNL